jgi:ubiquinone/menaquinone biosynthesis C-methylase UbiE
VKAISEQVVPGSRLREWIQSQLPTPPARVLEVGCGNGRLARALVRAGYDVVAVDPRAPTGRIFRRCRIEDLEEEGRFDAAVASIALHHVESLSVVLEKMSGLLRPRGRVIVNEFAWDQFNRKTAAWLWSRRSALSPRMRRRFGGRSPAACLEKWRRTFRDLHTYGQMRRALDRRFSPRFFAWTPYLYDYLGGVTTEPQERALIAAGRVRPLGFRYIGQRRG